MTDIYLLSLFILLMMIIVVVFFVCVGYLFMCHNNIYFLCILPGSMFIMPALIWSKLVCGLARAAPSKVQKIC